MCPLEDITKCGNQRTVVYVRIYYTRGFQNGQVHYSTSIQNHDLETVESAEEAAMGAAKT